MGRSIRVERGVNTIVTHEDLGQNELAIHFVGTADLPQYADPRGRQSALPGRANSRLGRVDIHLIQTMTQATATNDA